MLVFYLKSDQNRLSNLLIQNQRLINNVLVKKNGLFIDVAGLTQKIQHFRVLIKFTLLQLSDQRSQIRTFVVFRGKEIFFHCGGLFLLQIDPFVQKFQNLLVFTKAFLKDSGHERALLGVLDQERKVFEQKKLIHRVVVTQLLQYVKAFVRHQIFKLHHLQRISPSKLRVVCNIKQKLYFAELERNLSIGRTL